MTASGQQDPPAPLRRGLLEIEHEHEGDTLRIRLRGELDLSNADALRTAIGYGEAHTGPVLLDISELGFMDSTGLRVFLEAGETLSGRLTVSRGSRRVMRVFELTDSLERLPFEPEPGA